ncbi:MAG: hypothetical protein Fur0037_00270 [Planctomycetota bacterium]
MTDHEQRESATPAPNDPTHDVNGRAVVAWVLSWTIVLFVGLYGLLVLFDRILAKNRTAKVEALPNTLLLEQRKIEDDFLQGRFADGRQGKTIEQTMREMAKD